MDQAFASDRPAPGAGPGRWLTAAVTMGVAPLWAIFTAEMLVAWVASLPVSMRFGYVAFEDLGGTLIVQRALDHGLRPTVDFYYPYGLLPLLAGRAWFGLLGQTPWAYQALLMTLNLVMAWGLARYVHVLRVSRAALLLVIATVPMILRPSYLNATHAAEACLICWAISEHARDRRGRALALLTACCFVKPTMAYVYGFLLLSLLVFDMATRRPGASPRDLAPAVAVGVTLLVTLVATYGPREVMAIQFPTRAGQSYKIMNYGFFRGQGRNFWNPPGVRWTYYVGTQAGFWLLATAILIFGGLRCAWAKLKGFAGTVSTERVREVIACAMASHVAFVCWFYGLSWDWKSYAYVLVMGVVALLRDGRPASAALALLLAGASLVGGKAESQGLLEKWRESGPAAVTAGLWATPEERSTWSEVLDRTQGKRPALISLAGCAPLLFPRFHGTESFYVHPKMVGALMPPAEKARVARLIGGASSLVEVRATPTGIGEASQSVLQLPEFRAEAEGLRPVWSEGDITLYERDHAPGKTIPPPAGLRAR